MSFPKFGNTSGGGAGSAPPSFEIASLIEAQAFINDADFDLSVYRAQDAGFLFETLKDSGGGTAILTNNGHAEGLDTGGAVNGELYRRIKGTSNVSNVGYSHCTNPQTQPWYMSAICQLDSSSLDGVNSRRWVFGLTSTTTTSIDGKCVGLCYYNGTLKVTSYGGLLDDFDTGWVNDKHAHRFSLGFDGTKMVALVDGVQKGANFTSLTNMPTTRSFMFWGPDSRLLTGVEYITYHDFLAIARRRSHG